MPVTVRCEACGKIFNIKDEDAGKTIRCRVCDAEILPASAQLAHSAGGAADTGGELRLVELSGPESQPQARPRAGGGEAAASAASGGMVDCEFCAEKIPSRSAFCPLCGGRVNAKLSPGDEEILLAELSAELHKQSALLDEEKGKIKLLTTGTVVFGLLVAGFAGLIAWGMNLGRNGEWMIIVGVIGVLLFGLIALISIQRDYRSAHIGDSSAPETALSRFLEALNLGRGKRSYLCLAPGHRSAKALAALELKKIPTARGNFDISDSRSFVKYWQKAVLKGPSGQSRSVDLQKVKVTAGKDGKYAIVEAEMKISSYPSWVIITVLLSIWICIILAVCLTKRETVKVRKLLVKHGDRWYVAEPAFSGLLDRLQLEPGK